MSTPDQRPKKKTRMEGYRGPGGQPKCAGCDAFTLELTELPKTLKKAAGTPLLCGQCYSKFHEGMKLCGVRSCLCSDDPSVGTSMCPVKGHRGGSCEKIFELSARTIRKPKIFSQCFRCREALVTMKRNQDKREKNFLESYTEDEKLLWKAALGVDPEDEVPAMPPLRLEEGQKPTFFSDEMPPHRWLEAHRMLLQWERDVGQIFPKRHASMDAFWHRVTVVFSRTFDPRPRTFTKEVIQPHLVAVRLLRALSLILKKNTNFFENVQEPTLEEWINVMKDEPSYPLIVAKFCIPLYKSQGLLPASYEA